MQIITIPYLDYFTPNSLNFALSTINHFYTGHCYHMYVYLTWHSV